MAGRIEIAVLGPVQVRVDGAVVPLSSLPQRVLLARLALSRGRGVPVGELTGALWAGDPPGNATGNLHTYVSRLRRVLGGERIVREPVGYRLSAAPDEVDVDRVERLVARARSQAAAEPAGAAALLGEALDAWRGEPLSDLADPLPFAPELARLSEWRRQLLHEWFAARLAAGQVEAALPELEEAATADPLREPLHLLWMRALHRAGRTAEALGVAAAFRRRVAEETGLDPSPALDELQRQLLAGDDRNPVIMEPGLRHPTPHAQTGKIHDHAAPSEARARVPADRFIGRGPELAVLGNALTGHRLVTVVGPGGVGKTRLALELLRGRAGPTPAYVVELAEVATPDEVPLAVAGALGLRTAPAGGRAAAELLGREPALLVVDNCEHLHDAVRALLADLLGGCPQLQVLATSRRRLGLPGERVVRLGPLGEEHQVELFCDRAALLREDFDDSAATRRLAGEICRRLDGLPLAVELAARREAVFGMTQLRDRLSSGLDMLEPARDGDRSTAVTAMVEWSYRLLDADARALFDRLAVCWGGFGLDALDHLAPRRSRPGNPAALLAELVDASLVLVDRASDPPRYRLLEVMRHVGLSHLTPAEVDDARRAHARWMIAYAEELDARAYQRSAETTRLLAREAANLREALAWLIDSSRWAEATRLGMLLALPVGEAPEPALLDQLGRLWSPDASPRDESDHLRALAAGVVALGFADRVVADRLLSAALAGLRADHPRRWVVPFFRLSNRMFTGDRAGVEADAVVLAGDPAAPAWAAAVGLCCAALINLYAGDRAAAQRWLDRDPALLEEASRMDGFVAYTRGELAAETDPAGALAWLERAYRQNDEQGHVYVREVAGVARTAVLIRLGLYQAMTGAGPLTAEKLAATTGLHPRLITEWLAAQTVSGYLAYDPAAGTYELPAEHAAVLSVVDSPAYIIGAAETVTGQYLSLDQLEQAFRTDGGIAYADMPRGIFHGIERFFRTAYVHQLAGVWFPAVAGLTERLAAGARVADVGCGHGVATLLMGGEWPASTFVGVDAHEESIAVARARAIEAGSPENVSFRVADATDLGSGPYDVVVFFDALHDLGDPPAALRQAREALSDGGVIVAVEPWSVDRLEDGIGLPSVRINYAVSTSLCTPCSLSQPGAYGLGTQGGPAKRLQLLTEAGFRDARLAADTGFNHVFAATK